MLFVKARFKSIGQILHSSLRSNGNISGNNVVRGSLLTDFDIIGHFCWFIGFYARGECNYAFC